jgi:hypothetical protein
MSENKENQDLDLIEDVAEVDLQDDNLAENVEVENEEITMEEEAEVVVEAALTKAGMVNAMYSSMSKMNKADLQAAYEKFMGNDEEEGDEEDEDEEEVDESVTDDSAAASDETVKSIEKSKPAAAKQPKGKVKESYDFQADLDALVTSDSTLAEGFQQKAATIFEAAVKTKIAEEIDRLEGEYTQSLEEETTEIKSQLVEKVDSYLNYVVEQWMEENQVAIENGLRTEIAESFMDSLKSVFVEHYIEVPESKTDMVDDLAAQVNQLEEQLTKSTEDNIRLNESVHALQRAEIIVESAKDLVATEAEKLKSLVEKIDFEDAETFAKKVATIKESYFTKSKIVESAEEAEIAYGSSDHQNEAHGAMAQYASAISRTLKN